jgi:hypothetical protein
MINVGITWGSRVYMEMVCDCKYCKAHTYKRKAVFTGDSFEECVYLAEKGGWLVVRIEGKCYCKGHHKYNRKTQKRRK